MRALLAALALAGAAYCQPALVLPGESPTSARRLSAARRLSEDGKPAEAAAILLQLIEAGANEMTPLPRGRLVRTRDLAQAQAARLPPEGLAAYRRKLEAAAERWVEAGQLERAVDEAFSTGAALRALGLLGDRAFLEGRFDEAEMWWRLIGPFDPDGDDEARRVHPSGSDQAARACAKQLLARMYAGRSAGLSQALAEYARRYPRAEGRLAGRSGLYADILKQAAEEAPGLTPPTGWPTYGGSPERGRVAEGGADLSARLARLCRGGPTWTFDLNTRPFLFKPGAEAQAARRFAFHPALDGTTAVLSDGLRVTAFDLVRGKARTLYDLTRALPHARFPDPPLMLADLRSSVSIHDGWVYARLGTARIRDVRPEKGVIDSDVESAVVGVPLEDGPKPWMTRCRDDAAKEHSVFEGAPLAFDGRVYIAASRFQGGHLVTSIHCYPARPPSTAPAPLWKVDVCDIPEPPASQPGRTVHYLLTRAGRNVVLCTHSGAVVAVNAVTGERAWAVRYPRREPSDGETEGQAPLRGSEPCLMAEGRLYAAPADTGSVLCLDPVTGAEHWRREGMDVAHLLGVGDGRLIFTTWSSPAMGRLAAAGLRAVGAEDGSDDSGWTLPDAGGLIPAGRGLLVGGQALWPTFRQGVGLIAVRQEDGKQPDDPSLLHTCPIGNLAWSGGILLAAGPRSLRVYMPEGDGERLPEASSFRFRPRGSTLQWEVGRGWPLPSFPPHRVTLPHAEHPLQELWPAGTGPRGRPPSVRLRGVAVGG
jgi:hypothetical protein